MTAPPRRRLPLWMTKLLVLLLVIEIGLPVAMWLGRNRLLFFPSQDTRPQDMLFPRELEVRVVDVKRPDGRKLAAYDVAPRDLPAGAPVVLFLHGNAGDITSRAYVAARFAQLANVRLLVPDYSGFGGNEGSPSEDEIGVDALAAYDHLVGSGADARRIVVFGESIGGGPAIYVATQRPVAGVAVQSTFSSLSSMAWHTYPWLPLASLLCRGSFPNADRLATLRVPALIVHGRKDTIVPFAEGERLAAAQPAAEFLPVDGADHNDLFDVAGAGYLRGLGERFRRWTAH